MLSGYLKLAFRNLYRSPLYTIIIVTGLSIGMTCAILLVIFLKHEFSYDSFHVNAPQIYRITTTVTGNDDISRTGGATGQVQAPAFKESIPEILDFVRFWDMGLNVTAENKSLIKSGLFADSSFFSIFSFPVLHGDPLMALKDRSSIVITASTALQYFGRSDVVGKILTVEEQGFQPMVITAVVKDPPANSSIRFDILLTFEFLQSFFNDRFWLNQYLSSFVLLRPGADPYKVQEKFAMVFRAKAADQLTDPSKSDGYSTKLAFGLQPLTDMHLGTARIPNASGIYDASNYTTLYVLIAIALFILLMACINFINLNLAHSLKRSREIGIRKINGSQRRHIIGQFMLEAAILCTVAFIAAIILSNALMPDFGLLVRRQLGFNIVNDIRVIIALMGVVLLCIFISGLYPAIVLSRFKAIDVLYHKPLITGKQWFGKSLVVFQFALAIGLITSTVIYYQQINFIMNKELGYHAKDVIVVPLPPQRNPDQLVKLFRTKLSTVPSIQMVGGGNSIPGEGAWGSPGPYYVNGYEIHAHKSRADEFYLPSLGLTLKEGRNFSSEFATDSMQAVIVNESFVKAAKLVSPVGTVFKLTGEWEGDQMTTIIGVVKDYHHFSMKEEIEPHMLVMKHYETLVIKSQPGKSAATIAAVEKIYKEALANSPFNFRFLEDEVKGQYTEDRYWQRVIGHATMISIFICSLGLFGLSWLATKQRTREIGIRKVLGARVWEIVTLLAADFLKLVGIAFLVAVPVSSLIMRNWLENFAYRIHINGWIFLMTATIAVFIALATLSYQAVKAALANPVDSLKTE